MKGAFHRRRHLISPVPGGRSFVATPLLATALLLGLLGCSDPKPHSGDPGDPASAVAATSASASAATPSPGLKRASRRLACEGLTSELRIDAYVSSGLPETAAFAKRLGELLRAYETATFAAKDGTTLTSRVKTSLTDPKTEEQKRAAQADGLTEQAMGSGDAEKVTLLSGFSGIVLRYGAEKEVIPFWPPDNKDGLEFFLSNKIRELRARNDKIVTRYGVLAGKGGAGVDAPLMPGAGSPTIKKIFGQHFSFYSFEDVDLHGGEGAVDAGLAGLIVTQPTQDFSAAELRRIDDFVMRGDRALVLFTSAVALRRGDPKMAATLDLHGLSPLLEGYGIEMKRDLVLDEVRGARYPAQDPRGGSILVPLPALFSLSATPPPSDEGASLDGAFVPFFRQNALPFAFASSLELHPERQPKASLRVVAKSSAQSTVQAGPIPSLRPALGWTSTGPRASRAVAAVLEGPLRSALPDGAAVAESPSPGRVLVISSAQFLENPFVRADTPAPANALVAPPGDPELEVLARSYLSSHMSSMLLMLNGTLGWMNADSDWAELTASLKVP